MAETKKVSWNASEGIIMELSNRRTLSNTFFINEDIRKAFKTLVSIKQSVIQSFKKEERLLLGDIEDKFNRVSMFLFSASANSFNKKNRDAYLHSKELAIKFYSDYNDILMDLLDDRGYLVGELTDASKMKF